MGRLKLDQAKRVDRVQYLERVQRLRPIAGDIVYSRKGERFGHAALIPAGADLCLSQRMMHFRPGSAVQPRFLMWALKARSTYEQAALDTVGATSPHVNVSTIRNMLIALPAAGVQQLTAAAIDEGALTFDSLVARIRDAIGVAAEYRTALISAAVTGKIDVRGEVA